MRVRNPFHQSRLRSKGGIFLLLLIAIAGQIAAFAAVACLLEWAGRRFWLSLPAACITVEDFTSFIRASIPLLVLLLVLLLRSCWRFFSLRSYMGRYSYRASRISSGPLLSLGNMLIHAGLGLNLLTVLWLDMVLLNPVELHWYHLVFWWIPIIPLLAYAGIYLWQIGDFRKRFVTGANLIWTLLCLLAVFAINAFWTPNSFWSDTLELLLVLIIFMILVHTARDFDLKEGEDKKNGGGRKKPDPPPLKKAVKPRITLPEKSTPENPPAGT